MCCNDITRVYVGLFLVGNKDDGRKQLVTVLLYVGTAFRTVLMSVMTMELHASW